MSVRRPVVVCCDKGKAPGSEDVRRQKAPSAPAAIAPVRIGRSHERGQILRQACDGHLDRSRRPRSAFRDRKFLIEAYAGAAVSLQHLNSKLALGQEIDISEHSSCVGALVRVASRLGIHRRQKDVQSLDQYLASLPKHDESQQIDEGVAP